MAKRPGGSFGGGGGAGAASGVGSASDGQALVNTSGAVAGKAIGGAGDTLMAYTGTPASGQIAVWDASDNRWEPGTPAIVTRVDDDGTVALLSTDRGALVKSGHATANAVSIAQAGTAGFEAGYFVYHCATGVGASTITPTTSTINGASTLVLTRTNANLPACALLVSDGTNYSAHVWRPIPAFDGVTTNFLRGDGTFAAPSGASFDPNDPAVEWFRDGFGSGTQNNGEIGELGWSTASVGSAPAVSQQGGSYPHVGILRFSTNASPTAGQGGVLHSPSTNTSFPNLGANTNWEHMSVFQVVATAETRLRIGFGSNSSALIPANGIYARYDVTSGIVDTTFQLCVSNTSVETCVNTTGTVTAAWFRMKMWSAVAGTVRLQMYTAAGATLGSEVCLNSGGTGGCTAATIPTNQMYMWQTIGADSTNQRSVDFDTIGVKFTSLAR